jgi:hypothetical protein
MISTPKQINIKKSEKDAKARASGGRLKKKKMAA